MHLLDFLKNEEKKVEYVELIYDLIFVYIIGRNNSLVDHIANGFIAPDAFITYVLCTLITIQIWYLTTLFINRYGDNGAAEYIGLFINMYLLYYMADGTRLNWQAHFYSYNIAWMLILVNILVQYYLKYRKTVRETPWESSNIRFFMYMLLAMIAVIGVGILLYAPTGLPLTPLAMFVGILFTIFGRSPLDLMAVDFPHLAERVMLYVVFTFGEMIIVAGSYFSGGFNFSTVYFSGCAFLIVVGLFMSYGFMYDKLLNREMSVNGNTYMLLHIFIIFSLSCLTMALEFMREDEIALIPKIIFLVSSFVIYYVCIFALAPFLKGYDGHLECFRDFAVSLVVFILFMLAAYKVPRVNIAISVLMTFNIWFLEYRYWKRLCEEGLAE